MDFVQTAVGTGCPGTDDINALGAPGAGRFDLSIGDDRMRADAAQSYLRATPGRSRMFQAFHDIALLPPEAGPPPHAAELIGLYEPYSRGRS